MKKTVMYVLLYLIFPIIFNVVFFLVRGTQLPVSVWISYAFIHLAYLFLVLCPFMARKTLSKALFKATTWIISLVYFVAEFVLGLIFIAITSPRYKAALIIQLILFAVYLIVFIIIALTNEHTADSEEKRKKESGLIKMMASRVKVLMTHTDDATVLKELERLYDALHASPSKSSEGVKFIEGSIVSMIGELESTIDEASADEIKAQIKKLYQSVEERNRTLMYM